jgi:heme-degrading monooxygenase HmoA
MKEVAMYARHVTVQGSPDRVDDAIRALKERVLPALRECEGFRGQLFLVDRANGKGIGISLWDTEENMNASEEKVAPSRQQTADEVGATAPPEVALYELPVYETQ